MNELNLFLSHIIRRFLKVAFKKREKRDKQNMCFDMTSLHPITQTTAENLKFFAMLSSK